MSGSVKLRRWFVRTTDDALLAVRNGRVEPAGIASHGGGFGAV